MWENLPLWAKHVLTLFASIVLGVFPGQYLAASTAAGHHNAPALTAAFVSLTVVGIVASIGTAIGILAYWINGGYRKRTTWREPVCDRCGNGHQTWQCEA